MTEPTPHVHVPDETELTLVAAARAGDNDAFRLLWDSVERRVVGLCTYLTRDHADALDAVQETQIATWRRLDRFEGRSSFATWALAVARNAALTVNRRRGADLDIDGVGEIPDHRPLFADVVTDMVDVRRALDELPARQREALLLWVGGLSYDEVAQTLGAPVNTVKTWIHRARLHLRERLVR